MLLHLLIDTSPLQSSPSADGSSSFSMLCAVVPKLFLFPRQALKSHSVLNNRVALAFQRKSPWKKPPGPPAGRNVSAASLEHRLTVIKHSVTSAGHAAAQPLSPLTEPQPVSPGRTGRFPSHPGLPGSRPRPLPRRSVRQPRPGLRGRRQDRVLSALQRREPRAGQPPPAKPAELGRSRISPSYPGWPARLPSRMLPQSGLPALAGSKRAPPRKARPSRR